MTITTQSVGCAAPTQPSTVTTVADVQVSTDIQFLSFTLGFNANAAGGTTFNLQRSAPTIYSGTWGKSGKAVLVVTGANWGTVNATRPCP